LSVAIPGVLKYFLFTVGAVAITLGITVLSGAKMGLFAGKRPPDLGWNKGAFRAPDWRPNWVSSKADPKDEQHYTPPLATGGDAKRAWASLAAVVNSMPRATVVTDKDGYMHVEFASARMGFVDDTEFALDGKAGVIQVLSGARMGVRDFGVNRNRVEAIRAELADKLK
jgi:uncharacterized protein (DUF1499 family)